MKQHQERKQLGTVPGASATGSEQYRERQRPGHCGKSLSNETRSLTLPVLFRKYTMTESMTDPRYPVGKFVFDPAITNDKRQGWIEELARAPWQLRAAIAGLDDEQMQTPYRDGGWTIPQVIHHLADSHMNSFIRCKLALTEDNPTIKPYDEATWAELPDGRDAPVELSLKLIDVLHERWALMLNSFSDQDWARTFKHPERGLMTLDQNLQLYAWHSRHHIAHITSLRELKGW